jgi:hypothetical protein
VLALILAVLSAFAPVGAQPITEHARKVKVCKGTWLRLSLVECLNTKTARAGDDVAFRMTDPLMADGVEVIPAGAILHARIKKAKPPTQCGDGEIKLGAVVVTFPDKTTAKADLSVIAPERVSAEPGNSNDSYQPDTEMSMGYVVMIVLAAPFMLADKLRQHASGTCPPRKDSDLVAGSDASAAISKSHWVRVSN